MTGCRVLCCGVLSFDSCLREIHLEPAGIDYQVVRSEFGCRWTRFDATWTRDVPCRCLEWRFGFQVNFTKPETCVEWGLQRKGERVAKGMACDRKGCFIYCEDESLGECFQGQSASRY